MRRNTSLFATHYQAGANVACGANADGAHLYQVSAAHCAQDGMTYDVILTTYYGPGVAVAGAQAPAAAPVALRFLAQPVEATSGVAFAVQPVVAVVDATGQTFAGDPNGETIVALALSAPPLGAVLTCTDGLSRQAIGGIATFDGCQIAGVAAPGVVLVASSAGLAPASTPPFTVAPAPPALTLAASGTLVTWGQDVQLSAALVPPGPQDASARTMHLQRSTDGATWMPVTDLLTDADGTAGATDHPATNSFYRLVFDGSPDLTAVTSPVVRVLVRSTVQLRPDSRGSTRVVMGGTTVDVLRARPAGARIGRARFRRAGAGHVSPVPARGTLLGRQADLDREPGRERRGKPRGAVRVARDLARCGPSPPGPPRTRSASCRPPSTYAVR